MKPIICLADAINYVPMVRVIKEGDVNYWKEFDISINNHLRQIVSIYYEDRCITYKYSEIQFLTPVQYKGRYIGLGDEVNSGEVFGYCYLDDGWNVETLDGDITLYTNNEIHSFQPLHQLTPKIELTSQEMIEELKRRGVVTTGNIINN